MQREKQERKKILQHYFNHLMTPQIYLGTRAVTVSDFHYMIIVAKRILNSYIIVISVEYLKIY